MTVTRAQLRGIRALSTGACRISNRTDPDDGVIAAQTVKALEAAGFAVDVAGYRAILTDAGRQVADDPPPTPVRRYDHATHACYVLDQCRCRPCRAAAAAYELRRSKDVAYGRPRMVDAEPVRTHVAALMASGPSRTDGVGLKRIARVSGVAHGSLWKLMYGAPDRNGPSAKVRTATADALLAVTQADRAPGSTVPAGPTRDRLDNIRAAGATWTEISDEIGGSGAGNVCRIARRKAVQVATAKAIHDLWGRLQDGTWTPRGKRSRHDDDWTPS